MWRIKYIGGPMDGEEEWPEDFNVIPHEITVAYASSSHIRAIYTRDEMQSGDGVRFIYGGDIAWAVAGKETVE